MPYIKKELRGHYDIIIDNFPNIENKGKYYG